MSGDKESRTRCKLIPQSQLMKESGENVHPSKSGSKVKNHTNKCSKPRRK